MPKTTIEKLREISFFSNMSDFDLRQIDSIVAERTYASGAVIIEERTEAERFFIVYRGKIEIYKNFEGGEKAVLSIQSDGSFFGEMAILDEGRRSASVRALEETTVLEIVRSDFEPLLYKAPILAYKILRELSQRLRETGALLLSLMTQRNRQLFRAYIDTMTSIVQAVEDRNAIISGYHRRTIELALRLGKGLRLGEEELLLLELSTLLHDLGMITVPEALLEKNGPLSEVERAVIRTHVSRGSEMLTRVDLLDKVVPIIEHHHERFDGSGYPHGLSGEAIPRLSRILAVADAFVAMTLDRPHRPRRTDGEAAREIMGEAGGQFDPEVVAVFRSLHEAGSIPA